MLSMVIISAFLPRETFIGRQSVGRLNEESNWVRVTTWGSTCLQTLRSDPLYTFSLFITAPPRATVTRSVQWTAYMVDYCSCSHPVPRYKNREESKLGVTKCIFLMKQSWKSMINLMLQWGRVTTLTQELIQIFYTCDLWCHEIWFSSASGSPWASESRDVRELNSFSIWFRWVA